MASLAAICRRLRAPDGCPWDRAQTPQSLAPYLVEEIHELFEALAIGSTEDLVEELGDALYLWTFFLQLLEERGVSIPSAVERVQTKLVRRHPHVFGDRQDQEGVAPGGNRDWERGKLSERHPPGEILRRLPEGLPALLSARRIQEKAAAFGFDWDGPAPVIEKLREELRELEGELAAGADRPETGEELGDLLFAAVNLARHLDQEPEAAMHRAVEKFRTRFNAMARSVEASGSRLGEAPLALLEEHWERAKRSPDA